MISFFHDVVNDKEKEMLCQLEGRDGQAFPNRSELLQARDLVEEALDLYEGRSSREAVFVWLLEDAPFNGKERNLVHSFLYNFLYA